MNLHPSTNLPTIFEDGSFKLFFAFAAAFTTLSGVTGGVTLWLAGFSCGLVGRLLPRRLTMPGGRRITLLRHFSFAGQSPYYVLHQRCLPFACSKNALVYHYREKIGGLLRGCATAD